MEETEKVPVVKFPETPAVSAGAAQELTGHQLCWPEAPTSCCPDGPGEPASDSQELPGQRPGACSTEGDASSSKAAALVVRRVLPPQQLSSPLSLVRVTT